MSNFPIKIILSNNKPLKIVQKVITQRIDKKIYIHRNLKLINITTYKFCINLHITKCLKK